MESKVICMQIRLDTQDKALAKRERGAFPWRNTFAVRFAKCCRCEATAPDELYRLVESGMGDPVRLTTVSSTQHFEKRKHD